VCACATELGTHTEIGTHTERERERKREREREREGGRERERERENMHTMESIRYFVSAFGDPLLTHRDKSGVNKRTANDIEQMQLPLVHTLLNSIKLFCQWVWRFPASFAETRSGGAVQSETTNDFDNVIDVFEKSRCIVCVLSQAALFVTVCPVYVVFR